jgi:O-antigen/teichoic acid export membrane protein
VRGRLGRNVVVGTSTAAIFIGTALLSVPLIVDAVGTAGYGVWTIAQSLILFVAVADGGLGTGLLRFAAVAHGAGRRDGVAQVAWTVMALYLAIGAVVAAVLLAAAPELIGLFDIPDGLTGDAVDTFRLAGLVFVLALVAAGFGNLQQGLERWVPFAVSASLASVAFIVALVALLPDAGLEGVAWAAVAQQGTLVLVRGWNVRDVFLARRPALLDRAEARQVVAFSAQMQMSAVATFANNQSDKVVVGLVAPVTTVGQLGIGAQVAEAGRLVAGTAINPLVSRMSIVFGEGGRAALTDLYLRLERLWTLTVIGATAIGGATLLPLIRAWLGDGHDEAALLGGFLVLAFGINLLTGVPTAFLRAVGQPGLEARYGLLVIGVNVLFTVALGVLFGARGVVLGTACAYLVATVWFFVRFRELAPPRPKGWLGSRARLAAALVICSAAALGWGLAMSALLPAGVALVPVGLGIAVAWVAFMAATTGVRPTLANARSLVA